MSEASHSSFFTVTDGVIQTTPLGANILPGITRNYVVDLLKKHRLPLEEKAIAREDLYRCHEIFLTGTTSEVLPVVKVDARTISGGAPGAITRRVQEIHTAAVKEWLAK